mgnify:FL=1
MQMTRRETIKYLWRECLRRTDGNRECTGLDVYRIEMYGHLNVGQCGKVKIENMKFRIVLQAQSS